MPRRLVLIILIGVAALPVSAGVLIRNLPPAGVTWEAATLRGELSLPGGETADIEVFCGEADGGRDPKAWRYSVRIGRCASGRISVPVEGLPPDGRMYYAFRAGTSDGEIWAAPASEFVLAPRPETADDADWLRAADGPDRPARGFVSARPADRWEDALISGNGTMGALVWSRPLDEKIVLSHERLFLPWEKPLPPVDTAARLDEIRTWMLSGESQRAADFVVELSRREGYAHKRWTDPLIPACDLQVGMEPRGTVRRYLRSVDFETGEAAVRWEDDRGLFERRLFVSRADNLVVMQITGPGPGLLDCGLGLATRPIDKVNTYWREQEKFAEGILSAEGAADNGWLIYRSAFRRSAGGYQVVARVIPKGGLAFPEGERMLVRGADEVLVLVRIEPLDDYASADPIALKRSISNHAESYDILLARHAAIHGDIFNRVRLDLGGGADRRLTSEDLIAKSSVENPSAALLEKLFDAGRYTILSSSGELPPTLQGLWTGTWGPPWSSDYTLNGNVQTAVAANLNGNMPEAMLSLLDYVESLVPASRENARRLYGARGILIASRTSTHGLNNHFDATWPMTFWTAGAGWLSRYFYDMYLYTDDETFLLERALPFMKESALFLEDFLIEGDDGRFVFVPSYSPENNPLNNPSQACVNATMDIAVAMDLLRNLIAVCEPRRIEAENVARWKSMLARMPDYRIGPDGALQEWTWPGMEDNHAHRHVSHLYPLFFGVAPEFESDAGLAAAARRAVELRMAERIRRNGGEMAFGLVQLGWAASSLGDGAATGQIIRWLQNGFHFRNLVSSHDPGPSLFNVDISGGLPDVIIRALVQSEPGILKILPARPPDWTSGAVEGILGRGGVEVRELRWNGGGLRIVLLSRRDQEIEIRLPGPVRSATADGAGLEVPSDSAPVLRAALRAGRPLTLDVSLK